MFHIGWLRGKLFIYDRSFIGLWPKDGCKWNAWVRDITARFEGTWLIRSEV